MYSVTEFSLISEQSTVCELFNSFCDWRSFCPIGKSHRVFGVGNILDRRIGDSQASHSVLTRQSPVIKT